MQVHLHTKDHKSEMTQKIRTCLDYFFIAGINYKKTDAAIRGDFAVNNDQYEAICAIAPSMGISEFFILSTCNRTEIYGFAENALQLADLLCTQTIGNKNTFAERCYTRNGAEVVQHLFDVGAGLESQIIGDYEITGQLKLAVKFSKQRGFIGAFTERLINNVLQSNKNVRNHTALSSGTVSVSFAAIQYIRQSFNHVAGKNILLLGTGKIGTNTCKNLIDYLNTRNITLVNRTDARAEELAGELGLTWAPYEQLPEQIILSDIILVATNAQAPTVLASYLKNCGKKLIIDLSVPYNVEQHVKQLPGINLVNVDELSRLKDETLQKRTAEIPKARAIIEEHKSEFLDWIEMRKNAPVIHAVKQKLNNMHQCRMFLSAYTATSSIPFAVSTADQQFIQRVIKNMALKMRIRNQPGCSYIEAINDFITAHVN